MSKRPSLLRAQFKNRRNSQRLDAYASQNALKLLSDNNIVKFSFSTHSSHRTETLHFTAFCRSRYVFAKHSTVVFYFCLEAHEMISIRSMSLYGVHTEKQYHTKTFFILSGQRSANDCLGGVNPPVIWCSNISNTEGWVERFDISYIHTTSRRVKLHQRLNVIQWRIFEQWHNQHKGRYFGHLFLVPMRSLRVQEALERRCTAAQSLLEWRTITLQR